MQFTTRSRMRALLIAAGAALAVAAPVVGTVAPASANPGSPRCITHAEWQRVHPGLTQIKVKRIVGYPGWVHQTWDWSDGRYDTYRRYQKCNRRGNPAGGRRNVVKVKFTNLLSVDEWGNETYGNAQRVAWRGAWRR